ncbi:Putative Cell surface spherulin 4-like protein [Penicillium brasilianum]|uniref:Putative Cell surface spherulin 4-like protein n=1 Tax=Penicillium brasilianum TaxID=104259 RepID=A0A0F7TPT6_PENBI|nr:Putative Cell surface spherulin 4-like protein [Penicillium brasilianum]
MGPEEKHVSKRGCLKSKWARILLAVIVFIVLCAAIIPAVVVTTLRKNNSMGPQSKVFVPLYVYPAPGAWTPLENVVAAYPDVNFTVVINPGNGPGPNSLPDANYTREVPILASYTNVRLLGYVHTSYAQRNISLVRKDIETYAAWPTNSSNPDLAVRGIFFDEAPQQYSVQSLNYLQNLTDLVKELNGFGTNGFVVHNPGAVPDSRYLASADSTVVFEGTYSSFQERQGAKLFTAIPDSNRTQLCAVIHSVPDTEEGPKLRSLVKDARKVVDELYITHLSIDYYASFGSKWTEFVDLMAD